jgi:hypothetical protein
MTEFQEGQRVRIVDGDEKREATFLEIADPDDAIEVEQPAGGTIKRDAAWVQLEDGETERLPFYQLRPVE